MQLTQAQCKLIRPGETLRDSEVAGLHLVGRASGGSWKLFYRTTELQGAPWLMRAAVTTTPAFRVVSQQKLFSVAEMATATPHRNYDVSRDGKEFVMVKYNPAARIYVIQNLPELVKRLASKPR